MSPLLCRWFAPIELHTKRGLRGNIVEPLGTHGYMKCKFSDYLKQNDEVSSSLVNRSYQFVRAAYHLSMLARGCRLFF